MFLGLQDYINILSENGLVVKSSCEGRESMPVRHLTYSSLDVLPGTLFVCKGAAFKREYLEDAIRKGAAAYVSETDLQIKDVPNIIVNDIREAMPHLARAFYQIPEGALKIIGITGTKGKTTTIFYLRRIFEVLKEETGRGGAAYITSLETYDGKETVSSGITTPESFEIYRHLRNAYDSGLEYVLMEISSQALKYKRVSGIQLDAGALMNISQDHISPIEHPTLEDYIGSKLKIFGQCRAAVTDISLLKDEKTAAAAKRAGRLITTGFEKDADYYAHDIKREKNGQSFTVTHDGADMRIYLDMAGRFNISNALTALAIAQVFGVPASAAAKAFSDAKVPGRIEMFESGDGLVHGIVDYAHNALSFTNILQTAKEEWPLSEIVTVFGSPGGKALNRRRDLAFAAAAYSDRIILTADDPAHEDPEDICREIAGYLDETGCPYDIVIDREEAVYRAVQTAGRPAAIMVLGKGCDPYQIVGSGRAPYPSDRVVLKTALQRFCSGTQDR